MPDEKLSHLLLPSEHISSAPFSLRARGSANNKIPSRDKRSHANNLKADINELKSHHINGGIYTIKFSSQVDMDLLFEDLDKKSYNMELLSIKNTNGIISANVRIDSETTFNKIFKAIDNYVNPRPRNGKEVLNPTPYIASIEKIQDINIRDLFTDDDSLFPVDNHQHWWELWLTNSESVASFIEIAQQECLKINERSYTFPDRTIILAKASVSELSSFVSKCNLIAEIRIAKRINSPIIEQCSEEQESLMGELYQKIHYPTNDDKTKIVVLDGNIITYHPLLEKGILGNHRALPNFDPDCSEEHATEVGGLALLGDISQAVKQTEITLHHRIEGVQILDGSINDPELYAKITKDAVQMTEDEHQDAFVMPVTESKGDKYQGKPSQWSAAVDQISFDDKKLFAISVGNVSDILKQEKYSDYQKMSCIESPAQAWNALSIGSYTELCDASLCVHDGVLPYADAGDISPFSRTSCLFSQHWPVKPDVLFEGGNRVIDDHGCVISYDAFHLVTCARNFREQLFTSLNATSASTGLAGKFMGELMAQYPHYWPETIRALIIHSAEWSSLMKEKVSPLSKKTEIAFLAHIFGYGIPNLETAKYSTSSALTLVMQKQNFQVFLPKLDKNGVPDDKKISSILMIKLPWPKDILQNDLREKILKLKITLSYFIEPNPSERGYSSKYAYQSHNLRFDLQRPLESKEDFEKRINGQIKTEETNPNFSDGTTDAHNWFFGPRFRSHGSVHKDFLETNGIQLADIEYLAVYSVGGWWKTKKSILPNDTKIRFSLIIGIDAGNIDINLYNEIQNIINIPIEIEI